MPHHTSIIAGMGMTPAAMSGGLGQMGSMGGMGLPTGGLGAQAHHSRSVLQAGWVVPCS